MGELVDEVGDAEIVGDAETVGEPVGTNVYSQVQTKGVSVSLSAHSFVEKRTRKCGFECQCLHQNKTYSWSSSWFLQGKIRS